MKALLLTLFLIFCSATLHAQTLDDLIFTTEEYPPFNFILEGKRQGISTDILIEILTLLGSQKTREDIAYLPWSRAYNLALNNKNILLYSTTRTAAREHLFKWVGPIVKSKFVLFAKKGSALKLERIRDINSKKLRVGVVLNDVGEHMLLEQGIEKERIYRYNKGTYLAQMLHGNRIDLMAYGQISTRWIFKGLGYNQEEYIEVLPIQKADYYFALSKDVDDKIVNQLQHALDQLKESGRLEEITNGYLY